MTQRKLAQLEKAIDANVSALLDGFTDRELDAILRAAGFQPAQFDEFTDEELERIAAGDFSPLGGLNETDT